LYLKSTNFWDYASQNPESVHQFMVLFGDRGIPKGYRKMHGYIGHTHKIVNKNGDWVYMQLHFKSKQGVDFITQEDSFNYGPDFSTKDLYQSIEKGDFPGWDVCVQTMTMKEAEEVWEKQGINIFDRTCRPQHTDPNSTNSENYSDARLATKAVSAPQSR
jgi:catalase